MSKQDKYQNQDDKALFAWLEEYREQKTECWDRTPNIGLYMDQVIGYLTEQLGTFSSAKGDPLLTPSMVNNYVKFSYIPRPERKRYDRRQIVALYLLCSMKQTLPIADAAALIRYLTDDMTPEKLKDMYVDFTAEQHEIAAKVADEIGKAKEGGREALLQTALHLTLRAEAMRLAAERIVYDTVENDRRAMEAQRESEKQTAEEEKKAAKAAKVEAAKAAKAEAARAEAEKAEARAQKAEEEARHSAK